MSYQDENAYLRYNVVKLWEQPPDELLRHDGLLPLATLCRADGKPAQLLSAVAQQIEAIGDLATRREQIGMAQVLAGLRFAQGLVFKILREAEMLEESTVYQYIFQRGEQRGEQRGVQLGAEQGKRELVSHQLDRRFGPLQTRLQKQIEKLSTARLEELSLALFDLRDVAELRAWLKTHGR